MIKPYGISWHVMTYHECSWHVTNYFKEVVLWLSMKGFYLIPLLVFWLSVKSISRFRLNSDELFLRSLITIRESRGISLGQSTKPFFQSQFTLFIVCGISLVWLPLNSFYVISLQWPPVKSLKFRYLTMVTPCEKTLYYLIIIFSDFLWSFYGISLLWLLVNTFQVI